MPLQEETERREPRSESKTQAKQTEKIAYNGGGTSSSKRVVLGSNKWVLKN